MPVGLRNSKCTVFDGPPRIVALGFQICEGRIADDPNGAPMISDLFDDPAFDEARQEATKLAGVLRMMGEFQPARLSAEAMEYTNLPQILERLSSRFQPA